ncbi:WD40-repeat-containing domain protein [Lactifluus volemus]|nr:WD40-repeat-containing domain protein [Lactifluus volemus]
MKMKQGRMMGMGHQDGTTSLRGIDSVAGINKRVIISSGKDGVVRVWDDRTGSAAIESTETKSLLSCDVSQDGLTVAAGTELQQDDALILYWCGPTKSRRATQKTHATHSDDITTVSFFRSSEEERSRNNLLLSGSTDGLVSISNADEADEDEAVLHISNLGRSISQADWIPSRRYAARRTPTAGGGLDLLNDLDIRCPSVHTQARTWVTDYLIGCHASEESGLSVLVGSNEGDIALLRNTDFYDRVSPWSLERLWTGHHEGVVRSALLDERANVLLTGGEDAKLLAWSCAPFPQEGDDMAIDDNFSPTLSAKHDHDGDVEMLR